MKLTKSHLQRIIKEELQRSVQETDDGWSRDPVELLEEIIAEVEIDAAAASSNEFESATERDQIRAETASNYLEPLNKLMELLNLNLGGE